MAESYSDYGFLPLSQVRPRTPATDLRLPSLSSSARTPSVTEQLKLAEADKVQRRDNFIRTIQGVIDNAYASPGYADGSAEYRRAVTDDLTKRISRAVRNSGLYSLEDEALTLSQLTQQLEKPTKAAENDINFWDVPWAAATSTVGGVGEGLINLFGTGTELLGRAVTADMTESLGPAGILLSPFGSALKAAAPGASAAIREGTGQAADTIYEAARSFGSGVKETSSYNLNQMRRQREVLGANPDYTSALMDTIFNDSGTAASRRAVYAMNEGLSTLPSLFLGGAFNLAFKGLNFLSKAERLRNFGAYSLAGGVMLKGESSVRFNQAYPENFNERFAQARTQYPEITPEQFTELTGLRNIEDTPGYQDRISRGDSPEQARLTVQQGISDYAAVIGGAANGLGGFADRAIVGGILRGADRVLGTSSARFLGGEAGAAVTAPVRTGSLPMRMLKGSPAFAGKTGLYAGSEGVQGFFEEAGQLAGEQLYGAPTENRSPEKRLLGSALDEAVGSLFPSALGAAGGRRPGPGRRDLSAADFNAMIAELPGAARLTPQQAAVLSGVFDQVNAGTMTLDEARAALTETDRQNPAPVPAPAGQLVSAYDIFSGFLERTGGFSDTQNRAVTEAMDAYLDGSITKEAADNELTRLLSAYQANDRFASIWDTLRYHAANGAVITEEQVRQLTSLLQAYAKGEPIAYQTLEDAVDSVLGMNPNTAVQQGDTVSRAAAQAFKDQLQALVQARHQEMGTGHLNLIKYLGNLAGSGTMTNTQFQQAAGQLEALTQALSQPRAQTFISSEAVNQTEDLINLYQTLTQGLGRALDPAFTAAVQYFGQALRQGTLTNNDLAAFHTLFSMQIVELQKEMPQNFKPEPPPGDLTQLKDRLRRILANVKNGQIITDNLIQLAEQGYDPLTLLSAAQIQALREAVSAPAQAGNWIQENKLDETPGAALTDAAAGTFTFADRKTMTVSPNPQTDADGMTYVEIEFEGKKYQYSTTTGETYYKNDAGKRFKLQPKSSVIPRINAVMASGNSRLTSPDNLTSLTVSTSQGPVRINSDGTYTFKGTQYRRDEATDDFYYPSQNKKGEARVAARTNIYKALWEAVQSSEERSFREPVQEQPVSPEPKTYGLILSGRHYRYDIPTQNFFESTSADSEIQVSKASKEYGALRQRLQGLSPDGQTMPAGAYEAPTGTVYFYSASDLSYSGKRYRYEPTDKRFYYAAQTATGEAQLSEASPIHQILTEAVQAQFPPPDSSNPNRAPEPGQARTDNSPDLVSRLVTEGGFSQEDAGDAAGIVEPLIRTQALLQRSTFEELLGRITITREPGQPARLDDILHQTAWHGSAETESVLRQTPDGGVQGYIRFLPGGLSQIVFNPQSNVTTICHEFNHSVLRTLLEAVRENRLVPELRLAVINDLNVLARHDGKESWEQWDSGTYETAADGFERYIREGRAPDSALEAVFRRLSNIFREIYRTVRGLGRPLTPEVRAVFDRMLTGDYAAEAPAGQETAPAGPETAPANLPQVRQNDQGRRTAEETSDSGGQTDQSVEAPAGETGRTAAAGDTQETAPDSSAAEGARAGREGLPGSGAAESDAGLDQPADRPGRGETGPGRVDARTGQEPAEGSGEPGSADVGRDDDADSAGAAGQTEEGSRSVNEKISQEVPGPEEKAAAEDLTALDNVARDDRKSLEAIAENALAHVNLPDDLKGELFYGILRDFETNWDKFELGRIGKKTGRPSKRSTWLISRARRYVYDYQERDAVSSGIPRLEYRIHGLIEKHKARWSAEGLDISSLRDMPETVKAKLDALGAMTYHQGSVTRALNRWYAGNTAMESAGYAAGDYDAAGSDLTAEEALIRAEDSENFAAYVTEPLKASFPDPDSVQRRVLDLWEENEFSGRDNISGNNLLKSGGQRRFSDTVIAEHIKDVSLRTIARAWAEVKETYNTFNRARALAELAADADDDFESLYRAALTLDDSMLTERERQEALTDSPFADGIIITAPVAGRLRRIIHIPPDYYCWEKSPGVIQFLPAGLVPSVEKAVGTALAERDIYREDGSPRIERIQKDWHGGEPKTVTYTRLGPNDFVYTSGADGRRYQVRNRELIKKLEADYEAGNYTLAQRRTTEAEREAKNKALLAVWDRVRNAAYEPMEKVGIIPAESSQTAAAEDLTALDDVKRDDINTLEAIAKKVLTDTNVANDNADYDILLEAVTDEFYSQWDSYELGRLGKKTGRPAKRSSWLYAVAQRYILNFFQQRAMQRNGITQRVYRLTNIIRRNVPKWRNQGIDTDNLRDIPETVNDLVNALGIMKYRRDDVIGAIDNYYSGQAVLPGVRRGSAEAASQDFNPEEAVIAAEEGFDESGGSGVSERFTEYVTEPLKAEFPESESLERKILDLWIDNDFSDKDENNKSVLSRITVRDRFGVTNAVARSAAAKVRKAYNTFNRARALAELAADADDDFESLYRAALTLDDSMLTERERQEALTDSPFADGIIITAPVAGRLRKIIHIPPDYYCWEKSPGVIQFLPAGLVPSVEKAVGTALAERDIYREDGSPRIERIQKDWHGGEPKTVTYTRLGPNDFVYTSGADGRRYQVRNRELIKKLEADYEAGNYTLAQRRTTEAAREAKNKALLAVWDRVRNAAYEPMEKIGIIPAESSQAAAARLWATTKAQPLDFSGRPFQDEPALLRELLNNFSRQPGVINQAFSHVVKNGAVDTAAFTGHPKKNIANLLDKTHALFSRLTGIRNQLETKVEEIINSLPDNPDTAAFVKTWEKTRETIGSAYAQYYNIYYYNILRGTKERTIYKHYFNNFLQPYLERKFFETGRAVAFIYPMQTISEAEAKTIESDFRKSVSSAVEENYTVGNRKVISEEKINQRVDFILDHAYSIFNTITNIYAANGLIVPKARLQATLNFKADFRDDAKEDAVYIVFENTIELRDKYDPSAAEDKLLKYLTHELGHFVHEHLVFQHQLGLKEAANILQPVWDIIGRADMPMNEITSWTQPLSTENTYTSSPNEIAARAVENVVLSGILKRSSLSNRNIERFFNAPFVSETSLQNRNNWLDYQISLQPVFRDFVRNILESTYGQRRDSPSDLDQNGPMAESGSDGRSRDDGLAQASGERTDTANRSSNAGDERSEARPQLRSGPDVFFPETQSGFRYPKETAGRRSPGGIALLDRELPVTRNSSDGSAAAAAAGASDAPGTGGGADNQHSPSVPLLPRAEISNRPLRSGSPNTGRIRGVISRSGKRQSGRVLPQRRSASPGFRTIDFSHRRGIVVRPTTDELGLTDSMDAAEPAAPPPPETFFEQAERKAGETWESLTNGINLLINSVRKPPVIREDLSLTGRTAPVTEADLARELYEQYAEERAAAEEAAAASPAGSGFGYRQGAVNPRANAELWRSKAVRLRTNLEDYQAPFRSWVSDVYKVKGTPEDSALNNALSLSVPRTKKLYEEYQRKILIPIAGWLRTMSGKTGRSAEEIRNLVNLAPALYHIEVEGAEAYRSILDGDLAEAEEISAEADEALQDYTEKAGEDKARRLEKLRARYGQAETEDEKVSLRVRMARLNEEPDTEMTGLISAGYAARRQAALARTILEVYDQFQETGRAVTVTAQQAGLLRALDPNIEEGSEYTPPTAGGISLFEVRRRWTELQRIFTDEELKELVDLNVRGFEHILQERVKAGFVTQEDTAHWFNFSFYVPLSTYVPRPYASGSHETGYISNPSKADYARNGSTVEADGTLNILERRLLQTATEVGHRDLAFELNRLYESLAEAKNTQGLVRVELNADETGARRSDPYYQKMAGIPGLVYRERYRNKDDQLRVRAYKFIFDFPEDAERTRVMRRAMSEFNDRSRVLTGMANLNRWTGQWYTRFRPMFAPVASFKDLGERAVNMLARGTYYRADGELIEGPSVLKTMGRILMNPDFLRSYLSVQLRGKVPDNRFGQYWRDFKNSAADYSWLDYIKSTGDQVRTLAGASNIGILTQAFRAAQGTKAYQTAMKWLNGWNNFFNSAPLFLQYAAFRESGAAENDAEAYTLDSMNYFKRGEWEPLGSAMFVFFRATAQGGANLIRALNPATKTGPARYRGMLAAGGLFLTGLMMTSILRSAAGDDDDENPYDAQDLDTVTRSMNFFLEDGSFLKIPLAFGMQHFTWGLAQITDRLGRGQMTPGQAMYHGLMNFHRQVLPDSFPAYMVSDDPAAWFFQTFTPQAVRPVMDLAINKNHWGGEINYGSRTPGLQDYEKGRLTTPRVWHDMAKWLHDSAGFDATPETLRYLMEYYAYGPWQGVLSGVMSGQWYEPEFESTRQTLGPFLSSVGASLAYGAPKNVAQTVYFREKDRIERELTARGVRVTDPDNKPGEKIPFVRRQMTAGGFDQETISRYVTILGMEKDITKINTDLKEKFNRIKGRDLDDALTETWFKQAERSRQGVYERMRR